MKNVCAVGFLFLASVILSVFTAKHYVDHSIMKLQAAGRHEMTQFSTTPMDYPGCSVSCRFIVTPTVGPMGPQGPRGLTGLPGVQGATGRTGEVGPISSDYTTGSTTETLAYVLTDSPSVGYIPNTSLFLLSGVYMISFQALVGANQSNRGGTLALYLNDARLDETEVEWVFTSNNNQQVQWIHTSTVVNVTSTGTIGVRWRQSILSTGISMRKRTTQAHRLSN